MNISNRSARRSRSAEGGNECACEREHPEHHIVEVGESEELRSVPRIRYRRLRCVLKASYRIDVDLERRLFQHSISFALRALAAPLT